MTMTHRTPDEIPVKLRCEGCGTAKDARRDPVSGKRLCKGCWIREPVKRPQR
jgi:formylmethanofuran dehydrogenase subunit E